MIRIVLPKGLMEMVSIVRGKAIHPTFTDPIHLGYNGLLLVIRIALLQGEMETKKSKS